MSFIGTTQADLAVSQRKNDLLLTESKNASYRTRIMLYASFRSVTSFMQAMREMRRVMKPRGWAILQIPFFNPVPAITFEDNSIVDPKQREKVFVQDDHVRLYGNYYPSRLAAAGFKVKEDRMVFELSQEEVKRFALPSTEVIYRVQK